LVINARISRNTPIFKNPSAVITRTFQAARARSTNSQTEAQR